MTKEIIVVTGYPRSGTAWLARLLGDVLDSPVGGFSGVNDIAAEGLDRKGKYHILQRHAVPCVRVLCDCVHPVEAWKVCSNGNVKVVHLIRNPLDIAVSWALFFHKSIKDSLDNMIQGHSEGYMPGWAEFVLSWRDRAYTHCRFKWLVGDAATALRLTLLDLGLNVPTDDIVAACDRQSIENKRREIAVDGDTRPYGKERQLEHLRRGVVGEWREHFTPELLAYAKPHFQEAMRLYGYKWEEL